MIHKSIDIAVGDSGFHAQLVTYFHDQSPELRITTRPVVLLCPGGGYGYTSDREAEPMALRFVAMGYHAAVLNYSIYPGATYPTALLELGAAVKMLRDNAEEWLIDTDKIIVMGFSAGGHLAASYSCFWSGDVAELLSCDRDILKPNGLILSYPVITSGEYASRYSFTNLLGDKYDELIEKMSLEYRVNHHNPPTFMWHTVTDEAVSYKNSVLFEAALKEKGISAQLHLYPEGMHGLALANEVTAIDESQIVPYCQDWLERALKWIKNNI